MAKVPDKATMFALQERGGFGNRLQMWSTLKAFRESKFKGKVGLRYAGTAGGGRFEAPVAARDVRDRIACWVAEGLERELVSIWEYAPHDRVLLAGEVQRGLMYLDLRYTVVPLPMRQALAIAQAHLSGPGAIYVLRQCMDEASWVHLNEIFHAYPDSVVEFTSFDMPVGIWRCNTVIWEVRDY